MQNICGSPTTPTASSLASMSDDVGAEVSSAETTSCKSATSLDIEQDLLRAEESALHAAFCAIVAKTTDDHAVFAHKCIAVRTRLLV